MSARSRQGCLSGCASNDSSLLPFWLKRSLHWSEHTPKGTREGEGCRLEPSRGDRAPSYAAGPWITCAHRDRHMKGAMLPPLQACSYVDMLESISTCTDSFSASRQPFFHDAFYCATNYEMIGHSLGFVFTPNISLTLTRAWRWLGFCAQQSKAWAYSALFWTTEYTNIKMNLFPTNI